VPQGYSYHPARCPSRPIDGARVLAHALAVKCHPIAVSLVALSMGGCGSPQHPATAPDPTPPPVAGSSSTGPSGERYQLLLEAWAGPHGGVPPWDKVETALLLPAIEKAGELYLKEVDAIAESSDQPTFENTLAALERSGKPLDRVARMFFVISSNRNTPEVQELSRIVEPKLQEINDKVSFNHKLFARVNALHAARLDSALDPEQRRLLEKRYDELVRRGANLSPSDKTRLGAINQKLAELFTDFGNRVQADEDTWVVLTQEQLGGLPEPLIASYKAAAEERKLEGYAVVNTRSAVDPFLTFSDQRALREKVWRAFVDRGDHGDKNDTNGLIKEIVKLRAERAKLLGYASHAHWRMSDTMAKDPKRAEELMLRVWPAAVARVKREVADMQQLAKKEGANLVIEPWDYRYYMEKVRKQRYALDQNEFKSYFALENMIRASYYMAERLYGYTFQEISGQVPVFHPDVRVYRVTNKSDGSHVGLLYRDDFARQYKRSGAWQATYQTRHKLDGQVFAIVSNNNNFTKGAKDQPVLISLDDSETLFHEFGHALHALSNDTTYPMLAKTPRDFVEFPSQVHEKWVLTREVLDSFARHVKTGEKMPQALIDKMRAASTFNQGFATVEYLSAAIVDMKLHTDPTGEVDPHAFEKKTLAAIGMPKQIVMRHRLPQFNHLFTSDAYSAGYYSYLWSDVMAADAWMAFEESGDHWHPATAAKFKQLILATGDAIDRAEAYRSFRGRDPKVEALLRDRGLSTR
jgi:peptidyl-dipeptidase Dcp